MKKFPLEFAFAAGILLVANAVFGVEALVGHHFTGSKFDGQHEKRADIDAAAPEGLKEDAYSEPMIRTE